MKKCGDTKIKIRKRVGRLSRAISKIGHENRY